MKITKVLILILPLSLLLQNCASTPTGKTIKRDGLSIIESPSGLKVSIIKKHGHLDRVCAPREADFAETQSAGGSLGLKQILSPLSNNVSEESTQGALSLGGRDPAVLILREMTYRACELAININANERESVEIYIRFLKIAHQMIATQQGKGTSVSGFSENAVTPISNDNDVSPISDDDKG